MRLLAHGQGAANSLPYAPDGTKYWPVFTLAPIVTATSCGGKSIKVTEAESGWSADWDTL